VNEPPPGVVPGPDGKPRCWWAAGGAPENLVYHDEVWGRPMRDETDLFEMLTLESFQSGLSWMTILRKQENFRAAFDGWDIERIASYGQADFKRLMADAGIVRNRAKIAAAIANAQAVRALHSEGETLADLLWAFAPEPSSSAPASAAELPSATSESRAMAKELKRRGFKFVGPTTAYSLMEAAGLVNDHLASCSFR
jgi:DNA-3-methyladenine glycosylase I